MYEGDLFDALPSLMRGSIDVLLCNTPYVPTAEIAFLPSEARDYEHALALDGGPDGLAVQRRVASRAAEWLAPGGYVLVEVSERQARRPWRSSTRPGSSRGSAPPMSSPPPS